MHTVPCIYTGLDGRYKYLEQLKVLEQYKLTCTSAVDPQISSINYSILNLTAWKRYTSHHPDKDFADYILNGIQNRFRVGINPEATYTSVSRNMQSASLH